MTPKDPNDTTPQTDAAPMSRREVLKELGKAPIMGALLLPSAWATPLMEFAQVGASPQLSVGVNDKGGTVRQGCAGTSLTVPLAAGDSAKATFYVSWFGVAAAADHYSTTFACSVTLDRVNGKALLEVANNLTVGLVSGAAKPVSATSLQWSAGASASPKITVAANAPVVSYAYGAPSSSFGDGTNSFVMDLQVNVSANTLEITRFESRQCPSA